MDALDLDAETEPPDGQLAEAVEGVGGGERHAVVRADHVRQAKVFERAFEDGEGESLLRGGQRLTRQEIPTREVGDREGIAVAAIAEQELALVIGAPEGVGRRGPRELGAGGVGTPAAAMLDEAMAIEHRMDGTDGGQVGAGEQLP